MDKKLLVSLMMATPVAAFAQTGWNWTVAGGGIQADILATGANWMPDNSMNDEWSAKGPDVVSGLLKPTIDNTKMTLQPLAFASGTYTFNFGDPTKNLLNVSVKVNGVLIYDRDAKTKEMVALNKAVIDNNGNLTYRVVITDGKLNIEVVKLDPLQEFGVGAINMRLNYNMRRAVGYVKQGFDALPAVSTLAFADNDFTAPGLKKEVVDGKYRATVTSLQAEKTELNTKVDDLYNAYYPTPSQDPEVCAMLWNAYVNDGFSSFVLSDYDPDDKDATLPIVSPFETKLLDSNKKVDTVNAKQTNYNTNTNNYNNKDNDRSLEKQVYRLNSQLGWKSTSDPGVPPTNTLDKKNPNYQAVQDSVDFCKFAVAEGATLAQDSINAWQKEINVAYAADNLTKYIAPDKNPATDKPDVPFVNKYNQISQQIDLIDYAGAKADWAKFKEFRTLLIASGTASDGKPVRSVENAYNTAFLGISQNLYKKALLNGVPVYTNLIDKYAKKLEDTYKNNEGYAIKHGEGYTWANAVNPKNAAIIGVSNYEICDPAFEDANTRIKVMGGTRVLDKNDKFTAEDSEFSDLGLADQLESQYRVTQAAWAAYGVDQKNLAARYAAVDAVVKGADFTKFKNDKDHPENKLAAEAVEDLLKVATTEKSDFEGVATAQYKNNTIGFTNGAVDDYTTAKTNYEEALTELENSFNNLNGGSFALMVMFNTTKGNLSNQIAAAEFSQKYNLEAQLNKSYKQIQTLINDYLKSDNKSTASQAYQNIETSINQCAVSGAQLITAFDNADNNIQAITKALTDFDTAANKKSYMDDKHQKDVCLKDFKQFNVTFDGKAQTLTRAQVGTEVDNIKKELVTIAGAATPQDALKGAQNFESELQTEDWDGAINTAAVAYAKYVSTFNYNSVKARIDVINADMAAANPSDGDPVPGWPKDFSYNAPDYSTLNLDGGTTVEYYTDFDKKLNEMLQEAEGKYKTAETAITNMNANKALTKALGETGLSTYLSDIAKITTDPALTYFKSLYSDKDGNGFKKRSDDIAKRFGESYKKVDLAKPEVKQAYDAEIASLKKDISNAVDQCQANETNFRLLLAENAQLISDAEALKEFMRESNKILGDFLAEQLAAVDAITEKAVVTDNAVHVSFAKGECVDDIYVGYDNTYKGYISEIEKMQGEWLTDYGQKIKELNNEYVAKNHLLPQDLINAYNYAINRVNEYRRLDQSYYYGMLVNDQAFKDNHAKLQSEYQAIIGTTGSAGYSQQYQAFADTWYKGAETSWVILENLTADDAAYATLEALAKEVNDPIDGIFTVIDQTYNNIDNLGVNEAATYMDTYYDHATDPLGAEQKLDKIYETLKDTYKLNADTYDEEGNVIHGEASSANGIDKYFDGVANAYDIYTEDKANLDEVKAEPKSTVAMIDEAEMTLIKNMNLVSAPIDEVYNLNVDKVVNDALRAQWTATYDEAIKNIDNWVKTVDPTQVGLIKDLNDYKAEIQKRNTEWGKLADNKKNANFVRLYVEEQITVDGQTKTIDGMRTLYEKAKAAYDAWVADVVSNDVFNKLVIGEKSPASSTQAAIDKMVADFGFYPGLLGTTVSGFQDDLDVIIDDARMQNGFHKLTADQLKKADIENGEDPTLTDQFDDLTLTVQEAYPQAFADAQTYLSTQLVKKAESALNTAQVNGKLGADGFNTYSKQISDIVAAINALEYPVAKSVDTAVADLQAQKTALCNLIQELDVLGGSFSSYDDAIKANANSYGAFKTQLTNLLNEINKQGQATTSETSDYGQKVIDEYAPQVQALIDAVDKLQNEFIGEGNNVIADVDEYDFKLQYIIDALKDSYSYDDAAGVEQTVEFGVEPSWEAAQNEATLFFVSDQKAEALLASLDTMQTQMGEAREAALEYCKNEKGEAVDPLDDTYTSLMNQIVGKNGKGGFVAAVNAKKAAHGYDASTDVKQYENQIGGDVRNYVVSDYINAFNAACDAEKDEIKGLVNVILGKDPEGRDKNENGWMYSYENESELVASLLEQYKKVVALQKTHGLIGEVPVAGKSNHINTAPEGKAQYGKLMGDLSALDTETQTIYKEADADKFIAGDVVEDGTIDVLDVQKLINLIGQGYDFEGKDKHLADVNKNDEVNIADVTTLINIMMHRESVVKPEGPTDKEWDKYSKVSMFFSANEGNNSVRVEEIQGENGLRRFAVALINETSFTAGQLDITVPAGTSIAGVTLGDRAQALDSYVFDNSGYTRVLMTSLDNALIEDNQGSVLYIDVEGNGEISVENVIFSDANGKSYKLGNGTTGIDGIYDSIKDGVKSIYNAAGQKLRGFTKGVNIIRNADGTTTKKIGK